MYAIEVALRIALATPKEDFKILGTASQSSNPIFLANALQMPMTIAACPSINKFFLLTGKDFLDVWADDVPLFSNDRFRAIVKMGEGKLDVQLVAYLSMVGMHWILALAAFDLRHQSKTSKGQDLRLMLAGNVNILPPSS